MEWVHDPGSGPGPAGEPLNRHSIRERFRLVCTPLGLERLRTLTIHDGHYTFVNHALAGGRTLAEARLAARQAYPTGRAWRKWEDELVRSLPAAAVVRQTGRSISSV